MNIYITPHITPLRTKPTLNPTLLENYRPVSLPFIAKTLERVLFNHVSAFLTQKSALLAGLPASSIKPLQLIQNAAARLIFNELKRTHITPLFINLHWLPIAARIKFQSINVCLQNHH